MARVSSLRYTVLEAGREGTKGCLALILYASMELLKVVDVWRPASLPEIVVCPAYIVK